MKLLSPKIFINGNKTLVNIVIDWLQSLLFFFVCVYLHEKKKNTQCQTFSIWPNSKFLPRRGDYIIRKRVE